MGPQEAVPPAGLLAALQASPGSAPTFCQVAPLGHVLLKGGQVLRKG